VCKVTTFSGKTFGDFVKWLESFIVTTRAEISQHRFLTWLDSSHIELIKILTRVEPLTRVTPSLFLPQLNSESSLKSRKRYRLPILAKYLFSHKWAADWARELFKPSRSVVLNRWSADPWGSAKRFQRVRENFEIRNINYEFWNFLLFIIAFWNGLEHLLNCLLWWDNTRTYWDLSPAGKAYCDAIDSTKRGPPRSEGWEPLL